MYSPFSPINLPALGGALPKMWLLDSLDIFCTVCAVMLYAVSCLWLRVAAGLPSCCETNYKCPALQYTSPHSYSLYACVCGCVHCCYLRSKKGRSEFKREKNKRRDKEKDVWWNLFLHIKSINIWDYHHSDNNPKMEAGITPEQRVLGEISYKEQSPLKCCPFLFLNFTPGELKSFSRAQSVIDWLLL